jgi:hypothetical protein
VAASNLVGLVIDSVLFLQIAFGSLDFIEGAPHREDLGDHLRRVGAAPEPWRTTPGGQPHSSAAGRFG